MTIKIEERSATVKAPCCGADASTFDELIVDRNGEPMMHAEMLDNDTLWLCIESGDRRAVYVITAADKCECCNRRHTHLRVVRGEGE